VRGNLSGKKSFKMLLAALFFMVQLCYNEFKIENKGVRI